MICFGEIIWDCLPTGKVLGGAQLNMSVQMHNMGLFPCLVTAVGDDDLGNEMLAEVQELGLDISSIAQITKYQTSRVDIVLDKDGKATYDIKIPVAWDAIPITDEHVKLAQERGVVFGSMAQRIEDEDSFLHLDQLLEHSSLNFFDANFRLPFTTPKLLEKYLPIADIFKINDEELVLLLDWLNLDFSENEALECLADSYKLTYLILTKGAEGSKVWHNGKIYTHKGHRVEVTDTVGCGDAFTAGFVYGLEHEMDVEDIITFASALSAVVASKEGGCCKVSIEEVEMLIR